MELKRPEGFLFSSSLQYTLLKLFQQDSNLWESGLLAKYVQLTQDFHSVTLDYHGKFGHQRSVGILCGRNILVDHDPRDKLADSLLRMYYNVK